MQYPVRHVATIRESVDSLYRDGADAQYMQYLSKSQETQPRMHFKLKEVPKVKANIQSPIPTSFLMLQFLSEKKKM